MIGDAEIEELQKYLDSIDGLGITRVARSAVQAVVQRLRAAEKENADLKHFIGMKLVVEPLDKAGVWMKPEEFDRNAIIEQCARIAECYEPHCESCPRGVANAILHLKSEP